MGRRFVLMVTAASVVLLLTLAGSGLAQDRSGSSRAGDLDKSFNPPKGYVTTSLGDDAEIDGIIEQSGGRIVAAGDADGDLALVGYRKNGSRDPKFGIGGTGVNVTPIAGLAEVAAAIPQGRGNADIVSVGSVGNDFFAVRHDSDGRLDRSFGTNGRSRINIGEEPEANGGAIQPDGKILVVGTQGDPFDDTETVVVARFNRNGGVDRTFGNDGVVTQEFLDGSIGFGVAVDDEGRIVVVGVADQPPAEGGKVMLVARFLSDGTLDTSFGGGDGYTTLEIGETAAGYDVVFNRRGKILVSGTGNANNEQDWVFARYNTNGTLDKTFGSPEGYVAVSPSSPEARYGQAFAVEYDEKGRIVATGSYGSEPGVSQFYVGRFLANGTPDSNFSRDGFTKTVIGSYALANTVLIQRNGRILVGGTANIGGNFEFALARYLARDQGSKPKPPKPPNPNACTIKGNSGDNILTGTPKRDVICGLGGDDIIRGLAGNDLIKGGAGNDLLYGQNNNDRLLGQRGDDALFGGNGSDVLIGGAGKNTLIGGPGKNVERGGVAPSKAGKQAKNLIDNIFKQVGLR